MTPDLEKHIKDQFLERDAEIARLRAENERLRAALDGCDVHELEDGTIVVGVVVPGRGFCCGKIRDVFKPLALAWKEQRDAALCIHERESGESNG